MSTFSFEEERHVEVYITSRPRYNSKLFDLIFGFCQDGNGRFKLALDVACGSGHQSTLPLAPRFEKVIGVDISEAQLEKAPKNCPNIEFKKSSAEHLDFLPSCSVDLVTAACGLHWFDVPAFFAEVERVLIPGGSLCIYAYGMPKVSSNTAQQFMQEFFDNFLLQHMDERHAMVFSEYRNVGFPFACTRKNVDHVLDWTADDICSFFASTTPWQARLKECPGCDSLMTLKKKLLAFYQEETGQTSPRIAIAFSVFTLLGRKPSPEL